MHDYVCEHIYFYLLQLYEACGAGSIVVPKATLERLDHNDITACIKDNSLLLANGKSLRLVLNACQQNPSKTNMGIKQGLIGSHQVEVLRDTGCSSAIVKITPSRGSTRHRL